jgi:hypothetical protein
VTRNPVEHFGTVIPEDDYAGVSANSIVMAALEAAIQKKYKTFQLNDWMAGSSPAMALGRQSFFRQRKRRSNQSPQALSGIAKHASIRNDPVSAQRHSTPQRARDDAEWRQTLRPGSE